MLAIDIMPDFGPFEDGFVPVEPTQALGFESRGQFRLCVKCASRGSGRTRTESRRHAGLGGRASTAGTNVLRPALYSHSLVSVPTSPMQRSGPTTYTPASDRLR